MSFHLLVARELQLLFGLMQFGNIDFLDPSNLLASVVDDSNKPMPFGVQQDLGEFMHLFLGNLPLSSFSRRISCLFVVATMLLEFSDDVISPSGSSRLCY